MKGVAIPFLRVLLTVVFDLDMFDGVQVNVCITFLFFIAEAEVRLLVLLQCADRLGTSVRKLVGVACMQR